MNDPNLIRNLCEKYGVKLEYRPYRMWHSVPHIHKTALVIDEYMKAGGHRIITEPQRFPGEVTEDMIKEAIEHNAYSLGRIIRNGNAGTRETFVPWYNLVGDYPPGYFTHRIGIDVSGK